MRRVTALLREPPPRAVHASRPAPITRQVALRTLAVATAVGVFITLLGVFSTPPAVLLARAAVFLAYSWIGALLGMAAARLVWSHAIWRRGPLISGVATGVVMFPAMSVVVWVITSLANGRPIAVALLPDLLWETGLICVGASTLSVVLARRAGEAQAAAAPQPPKFLERLPLKLRGADVWAVEAEDHYLRLHTSKGQDLILMRLADAIAELEGVEGAQVHRSWWVAREAIVDAERADGRATLTLKDGSQVPVSRTYAAQLRERRWI
jgi:hypothetical protein